MTSTSNSEDELRHLEALITTLQRRRHLLEIQRTRLGDLTPASATISLELEDIEHQLAQVQTNLRRIRPDPTDAQSPYLGLLTFQEDDSTFFFGRDALVGELLSKAEHTSFLAVLGSSGSGKSSVVRAGLVPTLKRGALFGSDQWYYLPPLKPGARPLNTLAATLAAAQEGRLGNVTSIHETLSKKNDALLLMADRLLTGQTNTRLVLVVDQAEELWTLAPIEPAARATYISDQQQPFIRCLLAAASAPDYPVLIILTMRADFLHRALEHQNLASWTKTHNVMVEPLTRDELQSAITRPVELIGGGLEPGLADTLVEQTVGRPGALPLLEYTLLELWKNRQSDGTLTWEAFKRIGGGVEGGLARRADTVLAKQYTPEQQAELRAILLRLVQPGEGAADTRRRVPLDDLVPAGSSSEAVQALLKPLADERLITTGYNPTSDEETVEVSHEALIRAWPTLGAWINTARPDLRLQIQLGEAAKDWATSGENPDFLWNGLRLANTEAWLDRARPRLNAQDQRFLDASRTRRQTEIEAEQARITAEEAAHQRELDQAHALTASAAQLRRRAIYLSIALVATLIVAVLGASAGWFWYSARTQEQRAFAQLLIVKGQTIYEEHPLLGARLAIEGLALLSEDDPARTDLMSITVQLIKQGRLQKLVNDGSSIVASPNHTTFVLVRKNAPGELRYTTGSTSIIPLSDVVKDVIFSPDSTLLVVWYVDKPAELRRADGSIVTPLIGSGEDASFILGTGVTFSPDSTLLAVWYVDKPDELRRADGSIVTPLVSTVSGITFSPDGTRLAVWYTDKPGELRHADGSIVTPLVSTVSGITFSPDSTRLAVWYDNKPGELRHADGSIVTSLADVVSGVTFSPDSTLLVVQYTDKPSELRRADGSIVTPLTGSGGDTTFSPDSTLLAIWYIDKPGELRHADGSIVTPLADAVKDVTFSPDGTLLAIWYIDKPGELRRADGSIVTPLAGVVTDVRVPLITLESSLLTGFFGYGSERGVIFSPDSTLLVVRYIDKPGELRRADGSIVAPLAGTVSGVIFSPDGTLLVVQYIDKPGELWKVQGSTRPLVTLTNLNSFPYDPKAQHLIVQHSTGQVYILDTTWLNTTAGYPETLSDAELVNRTCAGPLSRFDEKELQSYLSNRTPKACH